MDLKQLTALLAVAEHGSFSAAARAIHTVQSNVSTHVARLEKELGATLVDRSSGGLTEEGEAAVARARRVQAELDALTADVSALRDEVVGSVRLGVIGSIGRWLVPELLEEMRSRHPNVDLVVVDATTTSLLPQLVDGSLDQDEDLLAELDVVVASVHSKLSMDAKDMTKRMVMAIANPHVDILGHCTGQKVPGKMRPIGQSDFPGRVGSQFDADMVFAACERFDVAVEINCRPERQDPPPELLDLALEWGCKISIDTDAHAPGQLEWQAFGCDKAARHGIEPDRIVNTWDAGTLVEWAGAHG